VGRTAAGGGGYFCSGFGVVRRSAGAPDFAFEDCGVEGGGGMLVRIN
jgi:hypothetical protein